MGITSAVAGGMWRTPAPVIGTIVNTIAVTTMIGTMTAAVIAGGVAMMIGAGAAINRPGFQSLEIETP
jgi:hypothetical protein